MRIFLYCKPSLSAHLGVAAAKQSIKRSLSISQVQGFSKRSRHNQKIKHRAGLYTPVVRAIRQTAKGRFRTPFGLWPRTADGLADFNAVRIQRLFERVFSTPRVPPWCRLETVDQPLQ